ncbi:MAG: glycosyltransferase family 39 protein [Deltaproteobacteria bacterium]|nr:glycosyltransferase family 39 protein [Deltaproteobacteria bacterium]MBI3387710.1 glycosyltransferase family 39 protein [Deltaproteobacteria bacterium]
MARKWSRSYGSFLLIGALVLLVYANSLPNGFVFDDHTLVDFNPEVNPAVATAVERRAIEYRPFRIASYVLDRMIGGHRPASYRFGNLVYHAITASVALVTYQQLGFNPATALLAAALFAVHPVQTESVAYISGRRDVLCGLLTLLGFSLYLRWRSERRWGYLALAVIAVVFAALSKEVAAAFPLLVVAYDVTLAPSDRAAGTLAASGRSLWSTAVAAARAQWLLYSAMAVVGVAVGSYFAIFGFPTEQQWWGGTIVTNFLNVALLWVHAAVLLICPVRLLADYSAAAVPVVATIQSPLAWAAVLVLLAVFALSCWLRRRAPLAVFLLWWIAATLLPSSHVIPHHDFFAEHYLYLPLFGFAGLTVLLLSRIGHHLGMTRRHVEWAGVLLVLVYGARTVVRNRDWRDDLTLWKVTAAAAPRNARAHANYGGALLAQYQLDQAEEEFRRSRKIKPLITATSGLIMVDHAKGRFRERDRLVQRLERGSKVSYTNLLSLAGWFLINKEYPLAIDVARAAGRRGNSDERALTIEGWARARSDDLAGACPLFNQAFRENPYSDDARAGRDFCRQHGDRAP